MSKALSNSFILTLSAVGLVVTLILTYMHYNPDTKMGCMPGPCGCHGVLQSKYGHIGPLPTSLFGFGMYAAFLGLGLMRRRLLKAWRAEESALAAAYASSIAEEDGNAGETPLRPNAPPEKPLTSNLPSQIRLFDIAIWGLALIGFATSWWLQYVAIFLIGAFCPWCLTSAILVTLIFLLSSRDFLLDGRKLNGEQKMLLGVSTFVLLMVGVMSWPLVARQFFFIADQCKDYVIPDNFDRNALVHKEMHITGDPNSSLVVVEFADYMCQACQEASALVHAYMQKYPGKFRLAFRQFPLDLEDHPWSKQAAWATEAAAKQGKFWEMHEYIFAHPREMKEPDFTPAQFVVWAGLLGLDVEKFKKDMNDPKTAERVARDIADGRKIGVIKTPTFFFVTPKGILPTTGQLGFKKIMDDPKHPIWKILSQSKPQGK